MFIQYNASTMSDAEGQLLLFLVLVVSFLVLLIIPDVIVKIRQYKDKRLKNYITREYGYEFEEFEGFSMTLDEYIASRESSMNLARKDYEEYLAGQGYSIKAVRKKTESFYSLMVFMNEVMYDTAKHSIENYPQILMQGFKSTSPCRLSITLEKNRIFTMQLLFRHLSERHEGGDVHVLGNMNMPVKELQQFLQHPQARLSLWLRPHMNEEVDIRGHNEKVSVFAYHCMAYDDTKFFLIGNSYLVVTDNMGCVSFNDHVMAKKLEHVLSYAT